MSVARGPIRRRRDGSFTWNLGANERRVLKEVAAEFRTHLASETPSSDPSLQRVFPPAHPDDPIAELEYERTAGGPLLAAKLEQLETFERCIDTTVLSEEDVLACMRAANLRASSSIQRIGACARPDAAWFSFAQSIARFEASTWVTCAPAAAARSEATPV